MEMKIYVYIFMSEFQFILYDQKQKVSKNRFIIFYKYSPFRSIHF